MLTSVMMVAVYGVFFVSMIGLVDKTILAEMFLKKRGFHLI